MRDFEGWMADRRMRRRARQVLLWSTLATAALYFVPFGMWIAYPLTLWSTFLHELGHGLAALAVGGQFEQLAIFADASGVAQYRGVETDHARAFVAAGGLIGPAVFAAIAFVAGRRPRSARVFLGVLAAALLISSALFVRNGFGLAFALFVVVGLGWVTLRKTPDTAQLVLVFLAVQAALSVFSRGDYLFTEVALTGAGAIPSDTAQIAAALGGSYWMWGLACGAFSVLVIAGGIASFWRMSKDRPLPSRSSHTRDR
jgi:hypothetical protein